MFKTNLLLVVLASAFAFAGCKKDEKPADNAPKTAEPATDDKAAAATPEETKPVEEEKAPEAAATGDMTREAVAEKAVEMFTKMNETVKTANGDCKKIAEGFTSLITEFKPVMDAGKKFEEDPANKEWFEANYGEKVKGLMGEMMGAMGECMTDPAIQKAFEGME